MNTSATTASASDRVALRTWATLGLLLLATMLMYMDRQALAQDHHVIQPFDQELWAANYAGYDPQAAMMTFSCVRQWNLMLLRSVPAEAMAKPVLHPERGEMTFRELIETMAGHDLNHLAQLEAIAVQVPVSR